MEESFLGEGERERERERECACVCAWGFAYGKKPTIIFYQFKNEMITSTDMLASTELLQ